MNRFAIGAPVIVVFCLFCVNSVISIPPACADSIEKTPHRIPRVDADAKIDAVLDEPFWKDALVLELKYEVRPGENVPPPVRTEVLLAHNDSHLYAAFRAHDPDPSQIRAHITDRDKLYDDDWVALVFDPFNDKRRMFDFFVNPLGVQADEIECSECSSGSWDAIWESAGRITDFGYVVELAIPFSSMRFQRVDGEQTWNFDVVRSYPRNVRHHIGLFPRDRNDNCYLCQAEKLVGFSGATPGRNVELDPTVSSLYSQERSDYTEGDFQDRLKKNELGLTARWGITPNITLNASVNPDFSQVEADVAQLNINTNFALYYPEKRPFFLEGAELFNTRFQAVYTRTLAEPDWGVKLTGKEGPNAIGFYTVEDNMTNLFFPGSQRSRSTTLAERSIGTVFRYRRDVMSSSTLGALATSREAADYYNRLAGVDGTVKFTKKDQVQFQLLGSQTEYPAATAAEFGQPAERMTDGALDVFYLHDTEGLDWYAMYREKGANFRADLGFVPRVGDRYGEVGWGHTWNGDANKWYTMFNVGSGYDVSEEIDGTLIERMFNYWIQYAGPLQSQLEFTGNFLGTIGYNGKEFPWSSVNTYACLYPKGWLGLFFAGRYGNNIDFANTRAATSFRVNPWFEIKAGRHLSFMLDHTFERLNVDEGRLYDANISQLHFVYQLNKRTFLRSILQYVDYRRNASLYLGEVPTKDAHVFSQLLFSYKINPQTVLYLGYSDNRAGYDNVNLTQTDRTLFAKIGYAWVM